jgi:hypothetical protein
VKQRDDKENLSNHPLLFDDRNALRLRVIPPSCAKCHLDSNDPVDLEIGFLACIRPCLLRQAGEEIVDSYSGSVSNARVSKNTCVLWVIYHQLIPAACRCLQVWKLEQ